VFYLIYGFRRNNGTTSSNIINNLSVLKYSDTMQAQCSPFITVLFQLFFAIGDTFGKAVAQTRPVMRASHKLRLCNNVE
jgi:hypothetical protein